MGPAKVRLRVVTPPRKRAEAWSCGGGSRCPSRRAGSGPATAESWRSSGCSFTEGAHGLLRRQIDRAVDREPRGSSSTCAATAAALREAVLVSSIFVDSGEIVSVRGRKRSTRTERATGGAIDPKIPVVVLVDRGSASASEITAGALRDRHRATLVGTRTFGKGLVQEVEPLSNGGALDITVANYYLPSGKTITRAGLAAGAGA